MPIPGKSLSIEPLESRRLLATLISPRVVQFQDLDGDTVDVSLSRPVLTADNVNSVFRFSTGSVSGDNSTRQGLLDIRLSEVLAGVVPSGSRGVSLRVVVSARAAGGSSDGLATIGQISAEGIDLGDVHIDGSLGRIRSGDTNLLTPGLRRLTTISLGEGAVPWGGNYRSVIQGRIDAIRSVDLRGSIDVEGGAAGGIGSIELVGSIVGGAEVGSGRVTASGAIRTVSIDSLLGGAGDRSGRIEASGFESIRIRSSRRGVIGGEGNESGSIAATGRIGTITVTGYVSGGSGADSGTVTAASIDRLTATSIGGGGRDGGDRAGAVVASGTIGFARASVFGGAGVSSGVIRAAHLRRVESSYVEGGAGINSGVITASGDIGRASITVTIEGGAGAGSGVVRADGSITQLDVGSIEGGHGDRSGSVFAAIRVNYVNVRGVIAGGDGRLSGSIGSSGRVGFVFCDRLDGGNGEMSGMVYAQREPGAYSPPRPLATEDEIFRQLEGVIVREGVRGGAGASSGSIVADYGIGTVKVIGSRSRPGFLLGGSGRDSGTVRAGDWSGPVPAFSEVYGRVGDLAIPVIAGGDGLRSGSIRATNAVFGKAPAEIIGGIGDKSGAIVGYGVYLPWRHGRRPTSPGLTVIRGGSGYASGSVSGGEGYLEILDLIGGEGERSGSLEFSENLTLKASDIRGGAGSYSGRVSAPSVDLTAQNIIGGSANGKADLIESGAVVAEQLVIWLGGRPGSMGIGELRAGADNTSGFFARNGAIIANTISGGIGSINGNATNPAIVAAVQGIGPLRVKGSVRLGLIVAGDGFGAVHPRTGTVFGTNPDASIVNLRIDGDLVRSSIAAGVRPGDAFYGNDDDARVPASESYPDDPAVFSRVENLQIRGAVVGSSVDGDCYGIVAEKYDSVSVGWTGGVSWRNRYRDPRGPDRRGLADGSTGDVFLVSLGRR